MDELPKPLGMLLFQLFMRRKQISPEKLGKIDNPDLANKTIDTYIKIIQAIQEGKEYLEINENCYSLPKDIPEKLMAILPIYLDGEERVRFFEQSKTGEFDLRGVKFHYNFPQTSEQEKLEQEIEKYITGGAFIDIHNLDEGLPKVLGIVRKHSRGNPAEDLRFAQELICSGQRSKQIWGRERLETILKLAPEFGYDRTTNDPEIKPKYDRLMEIYAALDWRGSGI